MSRAVLFAAGLGTRLGALGASTPKCLLPIQGRPLLDYWLEMLKSGDVSRALVNLHHQASQVEAYLNGSPYLDFVDTVCEESLLLTGGTLKANRKWILTDGRKPFLAIHADNLSRFSINRMFAAHAARPSGCLATMLVFRTPDPSSCGIIERDSQGIVRAFHEKVTQPPGNLANGAVYVFEPEVLDILESLPGNRIDLSTQVLPQLVGRMATFDDVTYHRDLGTIESWQAAEREFRA